MGVGGECGLWHIPCLLLRYVVHAWQNVDTEELAEGCGGAPTLQARPHTNLYKYVWNIFLK